MPRSSVPFGDRSSGKSARSAAGAFPAVKNGGSLVTMEDSQTHQPQVRITSRLIDSLYTEAMLLADEARSYFDDIGRDERQTLEPFARVGFACESLKVTTRVMHIVAWLLTQRAIESGEIPMIEGRRPERRLGNAQDSDPAVVDQLPPAARRLINASADLYARIKRIDEGSFEAEAPQSPARALMGRLERGLGGQSV
jgi:regulator of CtrA degradation